MILLLNIVFGLLAGWLTYYVLNNKAGVDAPISVVAAVVVGLIVYLANLAAQVV